MIGYFKNILTDSRNVAKVSEIFYPFYVVIYDKKYLYHEDLHSIGVMISSLDGDVLLCVPANLFLEETAILMKESNNSGDKISTVNTFVENLFRNNVKDTSKFKSYVKIFWLDLCSNHIGSSATLLNASGDNTNFIFEVSGNMDDEKMVRFNNIFKETKRKGETCLNIATTDRMQYLHQIGCDIQFVGTVENDARANLIKCGGMEMPAIVGGMLKKFYFENLSGPTSVEDCIDYLAENDIVGYGFDDLQNTYRGKIAHFLLCTFTGMRLGSPWNGRQQVNGGYIVVKNNGDVVAFHSTIADEFKDFLVAKIRMEGPSHSRHKDMVIYKKGDRYFLKLALQLRFTLSR